MTKAKKSDETEEVKEIDETTKNSLFIVVKKESIEGFKILDEAKNEFTDLSEYVLEEGKIAKIILNRKADQLEWSITDVPLMDVAKAFKGEDEKSDV